MLLRGCKRVSPKEIILSSGDRTYATYIGTIVIGTESGRQLDSFERSLALYRLLFVPQLKTKLLSCLRLCNDGYQLNSLHDECNGMLHGTAQLQGHVQQGVCHIEGYALAPENKEPCTQRLVNVSS